MAIFRRLPYAILVILGAGGLPACDRGSQTSEQDRGTSIASGRPTETPSQTGDPGMPSLTLTSPAFRNGERIPTVHTGEGADRSPRLEWAGVPKGTKSFALVCDDPDAPSPRKPNPDPWVHWVIYNLPSTATSLPEGVPREREWTDGAIQGVNSWPEDNVGYLGPMPPRGSGVHRYFFKLYALDTELRLEPDKVTKAILMDAISEHVLQEANLMGVYEIQ